MVNEASCGCAIFFGQDWLQAQAGVRKLCQKIKHSVSSTFSPLLHVHILQKAPEISNGSRPSPPFQSAQGRWWKDGDGHCRSQGARKNLQCIKPSSNGWQVCGCLECVSGIHLNHTFLDLLGLASLSFWWFFFWRPNRQTMLLTCSLHFSFEETIIMAMLNSFGACWSVCSYSTQCLLLPSRTTGACRGTFWFCGQLIWCSNVVYHVIALYQSYVLNGYYIKSIGCPTKKGRKTTTPKEICSKKKSEKMAPQDHTPPEISPRILSQTLHHCRALLCGALVWWQRPCLCVGEISALMDLAGACLEGSEVYERRKSLHREWWTELPLRFRETHILVCWGSLRSSLKSFFVTVGCCVFCFAMLWCLQRKSRHAESHPLILVLWKATLVRDDSCFWSEI